MEQAAQERKKASRLSDEMKREMTDSDIWAHALALQATRLDRRSQWLGVPVTVITAMTGTAIFASLNTPNHVSAQVAFGSATLLAAVLSALHNYLGYNDRAKQARVSADEYAEVHEAFCAIQEDVRRGLDIDPRRIASLTRRYDRARKSRPMIPDKVWAAAKESVTHGRACDPPRRP